MNIINDPWLYVKYLDGHITQVSVRQAFIDAEKIQNIETPTFHNTKVYIYDVPVIQLLATIVLAAYFKPEYNFRSSSKYFSKELMNKGWDIDIILNYLDKWQDRFNIDDNTYPFLQDIRLKPILDYENKDKIKYVTKVNIIAPNTESPKFEHNSNIPMNIEEFTPSLDELAYILIYDGSMGTSINADNYPGKSLTANCTLFAIGIGETLKDTIIYNCLPLRDSIKEEDMYDKPIWEFDNRDDVLQYINKDTNIGNNVLMCSFFPSFPLLAAIKDNELVDFVYANRKHSDEKICIIDKSIRESISQNYIFNNPWAIRTSGLDDDKNEVVKYKSWSNSIKLLNLCIDITKHLTSSDACDIISTEYQLNKGSKISIYYREYDKMKCNLLSFGKYEVDQNILEYLQNSANHDKAEQFQKILDRIEKSFNEFKASGFGNIVVDSTKLRFSRFAEHYFFNEFCTNIEDDNIIKQSIDILIKEAKTLAKSFETITNNPLNYAKSYKKFSGNLNKLKEAVYV